jgi:hypothetical protein
MRKQLFFAAAGGGTVIAGGWLARRYRHDLDAARARLAAVDRTAISTAFGAVEYAERGAGEPVLSSSPRSHLTATWPGQRDHAAALSG